MAEPAGIGVHKDRFPPFTIGNTALRTLQIHVIRSNTFPVAQILSTRGGILSVALWSSYPVRRDSTEAWDSCSTLVLPP